MRIARVTQRELALYGVLEAAVQDAADAVLPVLAALATRARSTAGDMSAVPGPLVARHVALKAVTAYVQRMNEQPPFQPFPVARE